MQEYRPPQLIEYGRIDQLTLGTASAIPDFPPGNAVGPACNKQFSRQIGCLVGW